MKAFKKLLSQIVQVQTVEEFYEACGAVDSALFHDKISAVDGFSVEVIGAAPLAIEKLYLLLKATSAVVRNMGR